MVDSASSVVEDIDAPLTSGLEPGGFRTLLRDSLTFGVGSLVGKVVGFVLVLVLARLMSPGDLGDLDVLMSMLNALAVLAVLQVDVAATRLYFDEVEPIDHRRLLATAGLIITASALALGIVVALVAAAVSTALFGSDALAPAIVVAAFGLFGMGIEAFVLTVLRVTARPRAFALVEGLAFVVYLVATPLLLLRWQADATAVMAAWAVGVGLAATAGLVLVRRDVRVRPDATRARQLLGLAAPLIPVAVAIAAAEFLNRSILLDRAGSEQVAFFAVGLRFASVAILAVTAFQLAFQPRAFRLGVSGEALVRTGHDAYRIVVAVLMVVLAGAAIAPDAIPLLAGDAYAASVAPFGWSLVAAVGLALFLVGSVSSTLARSTRDLAVAASIGAAAGLALNLLLAAPMGAVGTAMAIAVGQLVAAAVVVRRGTRHAPPSIPWPAVLTLCTVATIAILAFTQVDIALGLRLAAGVLLEAVLVRELVRGRSR